MEKVNGQISLVNPGGELSLTRTRGFSGKSVCDKVRVALVWGISDLLPLGALRTVRVRRNP